MKNWNIYVVFWCLLFLMNCKNSEEKTMVSSNDKVEITEDNKAIKNEVSKQSAINSSTLKVDLSGNTIIDKNDFQANVIFLKKALSIELVEGKSTLTIIVRGNNIWEQQPIKSVFENSTDANQLKTIMTAGTIVENDGNDIQKIPMVFEGELTVSKLTEKEVIIKISGKGEILDYASSKEQWKPISMTIICKNPNIKISGANKETVYY